MDLILKVVTLNDKQNIETLFLEIENKATFGILSEYERYS